MSDGTLQTLDVTMLDDVNNASGLIQLDSNAKIPACSGAALTNLPGITKNASDPAIATNPSGGVGTVWQNTTSGEMYICTDATAGSNVWTNIGAGTGDVEPWAFQGLSYGYTSGGHYNGSQLNVIDKHSFTTDGNATDVGDLTAIRTSGSGISGTTHGYTAGGRGPSWPPQLNSIEKFSFSSDGNAVDGADLLTANSETAGQSSTTHGYVSGGNLSPHSNVIQKFSTVSDANATDVGNLTVGRKGCQGVSAPTYGYTAGGGSPYQNHIDKFPFASDSNATDVGDLSNPRASGACTSSTTYGYMGGGDDPSTPPGANSIEKWSFASDGNATSHGNLTREVYGCCGSSSTSHGYTAGGYITGGYNNIIDKYAFTSNTTATDVGDLSTARGDRPQGHQV